MAMSKTGTTHSTEIDADESLAKATFKAIKGSFNADGAGNSLKPQRDVVGAYSIVKNGIRPTAKNKLKKPITFIEQVDSKGRIVQHYMSKCEVTGKKKMLCRFKPLNQQSA